MAAKMFNASAQPELLQTWPTNNPELQGALLDFLAGWSTWHYVVAFLLGVVIYDQGKQEC
jgi:C-22 sterol desaturase